MKDSVTNSKKDPPVVYACSGCSDAGELADRIARGLAEAGDAEMSCLAGIGGRVKSLTRKAEAAGRILVVDGCPLNCAAHTMELAGFAAFEHLELQKLGLKKGSCPVTTENIAKGVEAAREVISRRAPCNPDDSMRPSPSIAVFCHANDKEWLAFTNDGQDGNRL